MTNDVLYQLIIGVGSAVAGYLARRWQVPGGPNTPAPNLSDKPLLNLLLSLLAKRGGGGVQIPSQAFQAEAVAGEPEPLEIRADGHIVSVAKDGAVTVRRGE
jgi:hypothetical protein